MITMTIVGALVILASLQYFLPRCGPDFLGVIIPILFAIAGVILLANTGVSRIRDILLPLAGFFALLCIWGGPLNRKNPTLARRMGQVGRESDKSRKFK